MQHFLVWMIGYGIILWKFKDSIVNFIIKKIKLPRFLTYFVLITPIIIVEEWFTCEIPFNTCIKFTLPAFWFLFLMLYFIQNGLKLNWARASITFGIIGWLNEMIWVGRITEYNIFMAFVVSLIAFSIYAMMAVIPSYYFEKL